MAELLQDVPISHLATDPLTGSITLPTPAQAGSTLIILGGGGNVISSTGFAKRTGTGGNQEADILDRPATAGETVIALEWNGAENWLGRIREYGPGLEFVAASNAGTGTGLATSADVDNQISAPAVTASGPGLLISVHLQTTGADTTITNPFGRGIRWHQSGPAAAALDAALQPGIATKTNMICRFAHADVDVEGSYPAQLPAGDYAATSVWLATAGSNNAFVCQALYADTSGTPTVVWPNETVRENSLPGTLQTNWFLPTGTNPTIAGFTDRPSYQPGDTVQFFVDSTSFPFRVEIYRLGYYGFETFTARNVLGNQAGYLVGTVLAQADPVVDPVLGSTSCPWTANATWTIPQDAASGQYYYLLRRTDDTAQVASGDFIVTGDPIGRIVVCLPDMTRHAYNVWGHTSDHGPRGVGGAWTGKSLYQDGADADIPDITHRAYAVDRRRPQGIQESQASTYLTDSEQGVITFLEAQGYDLCYLSNWDLDADPTILTRASMVIVLGHHEYWTTGVYDAFEAAQAAGVSMLIDSSNTALWHVRFAADDVDRATIICYKESATADEGPNPDLPGDGFDPDGYTGTWRDTRQVIGGVNNPDIRSEDALTGQLFVASGPVQDTLSVPAASKSLPIWRNSPDIQSLADGQEYVTAVNELGFECDYPSGGPHQPTNLVNLNPYQKSFTTGANPAGSTYDQHVGPITLGFTLHRVPASGALVFNTGNWRGLLGVSRWQGGAFSGHVVDLNMQNAVLAVLYDLGARPVTLTEMQPGVDTPLTDPAIGAPTGGRADIARAYGLSVPATGFMSFFV